VNHPHATTRASDDRPPHKERAWVVAYDGPDIEAARAAFAEYERLLAVGAVPGVLLCDKESRLAVLSSSKGERRIGVGSSGASRLLDLFGRPLSRSPAYARLGARSTLLAWSSLDRSWNMRFEVEPNTEVPSFADTSRELRRRVRLARDILDAAAEPSEPELAKAILNARDGVMAAATAQACEDRASTWHQDERVLGGVGGMQHAPAGHRRLSAQGVEAIEALPTVLHIEHRRGRDPFRSRDVESVSLYAPVSMCMDAGGPMERLRALTSIPDGRTWCTR
jgi:hypothetical protein